jgi:hypothetical protein
MSAKSAKAFPLKSLVPVITQLTWVAPPSGRKPKSAWLTAAMGLRNSSRIPTFCAGRLSVMVIFPSPTLAFPVQA